MKLTGWADRLNPVLVRELRPTLRRALFGWGLSIELAAGLLAVLYVTVRGASDEGDELFASLRFALSLGLLVQVPFAAWLSTDEDLREGVLEDLSLTPMSPWRQGLGKLQIVLVHAALHAAAFAPFLAVASLLPRVGLRSVFAAVLALVARSAALGALAILCATLGGGGSGRALAGSLLAVVVAGMLGLELRAALGVFADGHGVWNAPPTLANSLGQPLLGLGLALVLVRAAACARARPGELPVGQTRALISVCTLALLARALLYVPADGRAPEEALLQLLITVVVVGGGGYAALTEPAGHGALRGHPVRVVLTAPWRPGRECGLVFACLHAVPVAIVALVLARDTTSVLLVSTAIGALLGYLVLALPGLLVGAREEPLPGTRRFAWMGGHLGIWVLAWIEVLTTATGALLQVLLMAYGVVGFVASIAAAVFWIAAPFDASLHWRLQDTTAAPNRDSDTPTRASPS